MLFRKKQVILEKQGSVVQCNQVIEGHCAKLTPCQGIVWLDTRRSGKSSVWTRTPDLSEENMNEYENIHPLLFGMISCLKNIHTRLQRFISYLPETTPWKINMEPTHQPFRKENDLNQTSRELCSILIFQGFNSKFRPWKWSRWKFTCLVSLPKKVTEGSRSSVAAAAVRSDRFLWPFVVESGQKTGVFGGGKGGTYAFFLGRVGEFENEPTPLQRWSFVCFSLFIKPFIIQPLFFLSKKGGSIKQ